jgi:hypothetical protein
VYWKEYIGGCFCIAFVLAFEHEIPFLSGLYVYMFDYLRWIKLPSCDHIDLTYNVSIWCFCTMKLFVTSIGMFAIWLLTWSMITLIKTEVVGIHNHKFIFGIEKRASPRNLRSLNAWNHTQVYICRQIWVFIQITCTFPQKTWISISCKTNQRNRLEFEIVSSRISQEPKAESRKEETCILDCWLIYIKHHILMNV